MSDKLHMADVLAAAVDLTILRRGIDSRSLIADCRLDYGDVFGEEQIRGRQVDVPAEPRTAVIFDSDDGEPLHLISVPHGVERQKVLEWYAGEYVYEAHKLTLMYLDTVRYPD